MGIFSAIMAIPGLITGMFGTINGVTKALSDAKIAQIKATTQEEKIAADERVFTLQARRDTMVAEAASGSRLNLIMRSVIATGPAAVLLKIFLWDKVIGSFAGCSNAPKGTCGIFVTDPLDANLWQVVSIVLGFYFLTEISIGVSRAFKAR
jgi:hypothetical protein